MKIPAEAIERKLKIAGMGKAVTERLKGLVDEFTSALFLPHADLKAFPNVAAAG